MSENVVVFTGELTIGTAGNMANELLNAMQRDQDVAVDISEVERIDCAALQVLAAARKEAEIRGIAMRCEPSAAAAAYAASLGIIIA